MQENPGAHDKVTVRQDQRLGDNDLIPESGNQLLIKQRRLMEVSHEVSISKKKLLSRPRDLPDEQSIMIRELQQSGLPWEYPRATQNFWGFQAALMMELPRRHATPL